MHPSMFQINVCYLCYGSQGWGKIHFGNLRQLFQPPLMVSLPAKGVLTLYPNCKTTAWIETADGPETYWAARIAGAHP